MYRIRWFVDEAGLRTKGGSLEAALAGRLSGTRSTRSLTYTLAAVFADLAGLS